MFNQWTECQMPESVAVSLPGARFFAKRSLRAVWDLEPHGDGMWKHLAVRAQHRYATWDEIKDARYHFFEDSEEVFQVLPPKTEYVNDDEFMFHLWSKVGARLTPAGGLMRSGV